MEKEKFKNLTVQLKSLHKRNRIHFDMKVYDFAGPQNKTFRQNYLEFLTGRKPPKSKCGIHALRSAIISYKKE